MTLLIRASIQWNHSSESC